MINSHCYQAVYLLLLKYQNKLLSIKDDVLKEKIGWTLNNSFKDQNFLQLKFWIAIKLTHCFNYKIINDMLLQKIEFGGCKNPIKAILLYIKFLQGIRSKFSIQNRRINQKIKISKQLCSNFIESFDSEVTLRQMILQDDYDGKAVMLLMYKHSQLLSKVQQIIEQLWTGPYESISSNVHYRWTQNYILHKKDFNQDQLTLKSIFHKSSFTQTVPVCNFYNFRESVRMKYIFCHIFIFLIATIGQYQAAFMADAIKSFVQSLLDSLSRGTFEQDILHIASLAKNIVIRFRLLGYLFLPLILTFSIVQIAIDLLFSSKIKIRFNFLLCQNISMIICFIAIFLSYVLINNQLFWFNQDNPMDYFALTLNIQPRLKDSIQIEQLLAITGGLIWIRLTLSFRLTKTLGPLLKIIENMTKEIVIFMSLQIIVLLCFAEVGITLFLVPEFSNIWNALIFLIASALGNFQFKVLQTEGSVGKIYLILFLIINLVLMLNLLIAILSQTFSVMESQGVGLYLQGILDIYENWQYREGINALTFRIPPFNSLNLIFFCLSKKSRVRKVSFVCQMIQYIPVMILTAFVTVTLNVLFVPLVWMKLIIKSCELRRQKRRNRTCLCIFLFYLPLSFVIILKDLVVYIKKLYQKPEQKVKNRLAPQIKMIDYQDLKKLLIFMKSQYKWIKKQKTVQAAQIIIKFRQVLGFTCDIADFVKIIQQVSKSDKSKVKRGQNFRLHRLETLRMGKYLRFKDQPKRDSSNHHTHTYVTTQRFILIKQFIIKNSFINKQTDQSQLYPKQFINSIQECLISEKLNELRLQFNKSQLTKKKPLQIAQVEGSHNLQSKINSRTQSTFNLITNTQTSQSQSNNLVAQKNSYHNNFKDKLQQPLELNKSRSNQSSIPKQKIITRKISPKSISCLSVGKMMRAQAEYYLENIDVGVMLNSYIEKQNALSQNFDQYMQQNQNPRTRLIKKRNKLLKKFTTMRQETMLRGGGYQRSTSQLYNDLLREKTREF